MSDPCFSCRLPDCDHDSPQCAVRMLANRYKLKTVQGRTADATDEERIAANLHHEFYRIDRFAEASEGRRPYNRRGSKWRRASDPRPEGAPA